MNTSTKDIHLFESGSGGEFLLINQDLALSETLFQTVYLALFGGNVEASTIGNETNSQERFDFWGNSLFFKDQKSKQFNSETEKVLNSVTINSLGRLKIKSAVEQDLFFLKNIVDLEIEVLILGVNKINVQVKMTQIGIQSSRLFQFIWDNAKSEIIFEKII
jgi:hypothetical protein